MKRLPWIEMVLLFGLGVALIVQPHPAERAAGGGGSEPATSPQP